ncbi:MAG TPA: TetR/AcrR family transcriptional regulator [Burkholderiaceae bacterium]
MLQAAWALIDARGHANFSLVELASETGLSRQTLYLLFGSRAGLLTALVEHLDANSGVPARLAALREGGTHNFEAYLRAWFDYLPVVLPLARALSAAGATGDEDARLALQSGIAKLRHGFTRMARALHDERRMRAGWTVAQAADWMVALTHVDLWQHLVVEARWKPADHVDRVVATLRETLLKG